MQLEFLRQHALATSISFGPVSRCDAITVLNCPAFAARNGPLLQQVGPAKEAAVCGLCSCVVCSGKACKGICVCSLECRSQAPFYVCLCSCRTWSCLRS